MSEFTFRGQWMRCKKTPHPDCHFLEGQEYWVGVQAERAPRSIRTEAGSGTIWVEQFQAYNDFEHDGSCVHIKGRDRLRRYFEPIAAQDPRPAR